MFIFAIRYFEAPTSLINQNIPSLFKYSYIVFVVSMIFFILLSFIATVYYNSAYDYADWRLDLIHAAKYYKKYIYWDNNLGYIGITIIISAVLLMVAA